MYAYLVGGFQLHELWFRALLHEGPHKCFVVKLIPHHTNYLAKKSSQSTQVILLACQELLEDRTQELKHTHTHNQDSNIDT